MTQRVHLFSMRPNTNAVIPCKQNFRVHSYKCELLKMQDQIIGTLMFLKPRRNDKISYQTKFKAFTENKMNVAKKSKFLMG